MQHHFYSSVDQETPALLQKKWKLKKITNDSHFLSATVSRAERERNKNQVSNCTLNCLKCHEKRPGEDPQVSPPPLQPNDPSHQPFLITNDI